MRYPGPGEIDIKTARRYNSSRNLHFPPKGKNMAEFALLLILIGMFFWGWGGGGGGVTRDMHSLGRSGGGEGWREAA